MLDMKTYNDPLTNNLNYNVSEQNAGLNIAGNTNIGANSSFIHLQMNRTDVLFDIENQLTLPNYLKKILLTPLDFHLIAWWNKTHLKMIVGTDWNESINNENVEVRFPRNF